jgi:hypothetical protein
VPDRPTIDLEGALSFGDALDLADEIEKWLDKHPKIYKMVSKALK